MSNAQALSLVIAVPDKTASPATLPGMEPLSPRDILARNLRKLIGLESVRSWALTRGLDVRLIDRMTKGSHSFTLDKVDEVANAIGVPAWQLLLPEFEPGQKMDAPLTSGERELLQRLKSLLS